MLPPPHSRFDTECFPDYWLARFDTGEAFELTPDGPPLDVAALRRAMLRYVGVGFNTRSYDYCMMAVALSGANNARLKHANDILIPGNGLRGPQPWEFFQMMGLERVDEWANGIDLIEVAPGDGTLKAYGAKMHCPTLQDLPYSPHEPLATPERRRNVFSYCGNDLQITAMLEQAMSAQLQLRREMGAEYGLDLRSKSDAQIAEAVMKKVLGFTVRRPEVQAGRQFFYRPPPWLEFVTLDVLALLARSPFTIAENGSPVMTQELADTLIHIGASAYQMGSGGLHSTEERVCHVADDETVLSDHDVASYYPSLILLTGIAPEQIGPEFQNIYRGWYERRLAAKAAGNKKTANSLKTLLNGTFGKLGSRWSIFYAPAEMIQVTITGQLALLMLIERLELCGIRVISANTDGIVLKTPRSLLWLRDQVLAWWEKRTGLVTEANEYRLLASRDVNSYVAIKPDGEVKTKGAFAPPEPGPSGWPNPTGQISIDAAVAWLRDGTSIEQTVYTCTDIRQFVYVRAADGGGRFCPDGMLPKNTTQKAMRALLGDLPKAELLAAYEVAREQEAQRREYLGKTVRWYYARGSRGAIVTSRGGLVPRTEGCRPCMVLPDSLPADIDHDWYVREALALLESMGVST